MNVTRRQFLSATALAATAVSACSREEDAVESTFEECGATLSLDMSAWVYDQSDDVYYQLGIPYCESPVDESRETLAIIVPAAYFEATRNEDGTYTCTRSDSGLKGDFTAKTAPIVMPINTPGYAAQSALDAYESVRSFTDEGLVYVHAGCRGRDQGAPAGVCDLKAAVRFLRLVGDVLPGDTERIFTFGMSGGGAQSALMGATGDSALYVPYLYAIGAVTGTSDAVYGSMAWCPITGLDVGDAAYEWMLGCTREGLDEEQQAISDGLATSFAAYLNQTGLVDGDGAQLLLEESAEGIYQAGSYYECVRRSIEESLQNFLADTTFPFDAASAGASDRGGFERGGTFGGPDGGPDAGPGKGAPGDFGDGKPQGDAESATGKAESEPDFEQIDDISRLETSGGIELSGVYETPADYLAALNAEEEWVSVDAASGEVSVTSVAAFARSLKRASKGLGAFDQLDRGQGENILFGQNGAGAHFDALLAEVLAEVGSSYAADFSSDLKLADSLGGAIQTRVSMYTPLYYLLPSSEGYGESEVARCWRIRSGINQADTALTTELNLALALEADPRVDSVDFASVWGQGHVKAERVGDAEENLIAWVKECMGV